MDATTKETEKVNNNEVFWLSSPRDVKSPEELTVLVEGFDTDAGRYISEGGVLVKDVSVALTHALHVDIYCLAFGSVLEEGHTIVKRCAELIQRFELLLGVPDIIEVVASQSSTDGESD